ncbi:NAC domain-containing protein 96 isoform X2 [Cucumis sativus]|uniref:NAC domain-containing protein n=1 Tax=Cucumis sativus TaxID=3659 RepID=A0A0A0L657_CUCSA|nr:NAC domain-containing protein 96 isoform X2 [Cucumis sativus]KGN56057.1 hypothetical protein Csa_010641 [Cucumis sativus]
MNHQYYTRTATTIIDSTLVPNLMGSFTIPSKHELPIGFRFRPTEEELVTHYLNNKILGRQHLVQCIPQIDLFNYDPWKLPERSLLDSDNYEWFFFRSLTSKTKRTTVSGCWRSTGDDKRIVARGTNKVIATRKILVFYQGQGKAAVKTKWVLHEYHLFQQDTTDISSSQMPFVVCRLKESAEEFRSDDQRKKSKKRQVHWNGENDQPALEDFPNTHQPTQPSNYFENEVMNSGFDTDDASSKMFFKTTPWPSESEPREPGLLNISQQVSDSNSEGNEQLSQPQSSMASEPNSNDQLGWFLNYMVDNDETDQINVILKRHSMEEFQSMARELEAGDTTSVSSEGMRTTIQKSCRKPLIARHCQYKEENDESQDDSCGQTLKVQRQPKSNNIVAHRDEPKRDESREVFILQGGNVEKHTSVIYSNETPTNCFWYILTTKRIHHKSNDQPIDYVAKVLLGFIILIMFVLTSF